MIGPCTLAQFIDRTEFQYALVEIPDAVFEVVDRAMAGQSKRTRRIVLGRYNPFGKAAEAVARELGMSKRTLFYRITDAQVAILKAVRANPEAAFFLRIMVRRSQDDGNE